MIRSTAHTIVRQGGLDARRSPDPGPLSSVTAPAPNLLAAARLALRVGGLTDSLTYPVVSGTGIKGGKKLCERAIPAGFRLVGRRRCDHLPRLLVLAPNEHRGRMRPASARISWARYSSDPTCPLRSSAERTQLAGSSPAATGHATPLAARASPIVLCQGFKSRRPDSRDRVVCCPCGAGLIAPARSFGSPPRH